MEDDTERTTEDGDGEPSLLDKLRDLPVGTLDPNIIGDAGPTDIPPGTDPPGPGQPGPGDEAAEPRA